MEIRSQEIHPPREGNATDRKPATIITTQEVEQYKPLVETIEHIFKDEFGSTKDDVTYVFTNSEDEFARYLGEEKQLGAQPRRERNFSFYSFVTKRIVISPNSTKYIGGGEKFGPLLKLKLDAVEALVHERTHADTDVEEVEQVTVSGKVEPVKGNVMTDDMGEFVVEQIARDITLKYMHELISQPVPEAVLNSFKANADGTLTSEQREKISKRLYNGMKKKDVDIENEVERLQWLKERFNNEKQSEILLAYMNGW